MRLAILGDPIDNQNAGVHVYTKEMVHALIRNNPGHEIVLIREKIDPNLDGVTQIKVWNTRLPIGFASFRLFILVPLILRFKKVNAVIEPAHFGPFNLPKSIRRITIIHDLTPILFPQFHRWHSQILQKLFLKKILNQADLIITNSNNTSRDLCDYLPHVKEKIKRIYPGKSAKFKAENLQGSLSKYGIQTPYFLFVGTIEPRKNLIVLLDAFQKFKSKFTGNVSLVIAGGAGWKSTPFFEALKQNEFSNQIHCIGFVDEIDLPTLYTNAIAVIYPSIYEGFGLPIVESMSCGTPVIAADNSSLREAGGEPTFYFETHDSSKLVEKMMSIYSNESIRDQLRIDMQQHANTFDWNEYGKEFWKTIEKVNS